MSFVAFEKRTEVVECIFIKDCRSAKSVSVIENRFNILHVEI